MSAFLCNIDEENIENLVKSVALLEVCSYVVVDLQSGPGY